MGGTLGPRLRERSHRSFVVCVQDRALLGDPHSSARAKKRSAICRDTMWQGSGRLASYKTRNLLERFWVAPQCLRKCLGSRN